MHGDEPVPSDVTGTLDIDVRRVLADFELRVQAEVPLSGVTGLFGPSGSGKSTLLRIIAGLDRRVTGRVCVDGQAWLDSRGNIDVAPWQRRVGYVFQDARLFHHLDVAGNLAFADRRSARANGGPAHAEVVRELDLEPLLARRVDELSGGERQRVALGRTLLTRPKLLLFDEPLAALDVRRKNDILPYIETLPARFGIPAIYVSHTVDEIVRLAERVVVLDAGRVRASGATAEVLNALEPSASSPLYETVTVLEATVRRDLRDLYLAELEFRGQTLCIPARSALRPGTPVMLQLRAGDVALATARPEGVSVRNVLRGTLNSVTQHPDTAFATAIVDVDGMHLRAHITRQAVIELNLAAGMEIYALIKTATFDERTPTDL